MKSPKCLCCKLERAADNARRVKSPQSIREVQSLLDRVRRYDDVTNWCDEHRADHINRSFMVMHRVNHDTRTFARIHKTERLPLVV